MRSLQRPDRSVIAHDEGLPRTLLGRLKNHVVQPGSRPRRIRGGVLSGLRMHLDLLHQSQVYLGLYERELHSWLRRLSRGAVSAIDAGAADGAYSLYFLSRTEVRSVHAFEPDAAARALFFANLHLNGLMEDSRLRLIGAAVGNAPQALALDSLLGTIELPCVIKVDVEGREVDVLDGAAEILRRRGTSWIIETHSLELERECIDRLERHNLAVAVVSPAWWRWALPEARPIPHNRWLVARQRLC